MDTIWAALLIVLGISAFLWLLGESSFSSKKLPPGPLTLPLVGHLPFLGPLPHVTFQKLSRKYGEIMHLKIGGVPFVIISSEKAAKELYKFQGLAFASKVPTIAGKYFGNGFTGIVYSEYTNELKSYRKLVNTHLLSASSLRIYGKIRKQEYNGLARSVFADVGAPVELRNKFHEMNMNIITYMLFGERFYGSHARSTPELDEFVEAMIEALRLSGVFNVSDFIPAIRWLDVQGLEKRYKQLMNKVNEYLSLILQKRRENPPRHSGDEPLAFIDMLISLDSTEERVEDITKLSLLFDMLLGAVDTSALSLEWAMTELLRQPEKLKRAREEVDHYVGMNRLVEESDLESLRYIEGIAKETLRLHPLAPLALPKVVQGGPVKLGGYTIASGTCAFVNFYAIGIDGNNWKNPMEFRPERFLEADIDVFGQNFNLLPFGSGRRVCPGAKLGFDTLLVGIATLVHGFEWTSFADTEMDMEETFGLVCHKTKPLVAVATPRLAAHVYTAA